MAAAKQLLSYAHKMSSYGIYLCLIHLHFGSLNLNSAQISQFWFMFTLKFMRKHSTLFSFLLNELKKIDEKAETHK